MSDLSNLIRFFPTVLNDRVLDLANKKRNFSISGISNYCAKAFVFADIYRDMKGVVGGIWIVNNPQEQDQVYNSLLQWTDFNIYKFSSKISTNILSSKMVREQRLKLIELLALIKNKEKKILVIPYFELLKRGPDWIEFERNFLKIQQGKSVNLMNIYENLIALGYELSDDIFLKKGSYLRNGDNLTIFPVNYTNPVRLDIGFDKIEKIEIFNQESELKEKIKVIKELNIWPINFQESQFSLVDLFNRNDLIIEDELDVYDDFFEEWNASFNEVYSRNKTLSFVSFNDEEESHLHAHYLSVLKYRGDYDLIHDLKDKISNHWKIIFFTKHKEKIKNLFVENNITFNEDLSQFGYGHFKVFLIKLDKYDLPPHAFQNPELKLILISDKEVSSLKEEGKKRLNQKVYLDFVSSLKIYDYVVHSNHGIGVFLGLEQMVIDGVTKEYLKIGYAENDKLFVPIDQADKVNKFIGANENPPKLTRLGSAEWDNITNKIKKETEVIARELLLLYAERKNSIGFACRHDDKEQVAFEKSFGYEETPGQLQSILDVKQDMEKAISMDRLICGDVGFGKTEVAMRAAFKAVRSGKQVVVISPITILSDQHYRSFKKRMDPFGIQVEMLSRFRTSSEQKKTVQKLESGEVDVVIGTHRLLQADIKFKDLGLVIVDEEQRFGVKQKEVFKQLKSNVDFLTLTATPIPRTLNIALNKLRDISIISTPPPGRLPVITEVRRFSLGLIREAILREKARGGQVYFLHNRVQTIESLAEKLRNLVPEASFEVAHGQLGSGDLEERIVRFKDGKFDVLVSSTIIENGIDLANANTLIVNNAEKFGLSQLYQLRGRVGRGKKQAYAYFLYHGQRLKLDAKKRLKAIVEASELGSGFQIAMKDLEIRGAGDILGAKQHGVINVIGVSYFIRMLNKAVEDLKAGRVMRQEEAEEVMVEIPISAFIPDHYIVNTKEKITVYQKLSSAGNLENLTSLKEEILEEYGALPVEVVNFFKVIELKILAKKAGIVGIKTETVYLGNEKEVILHMSNLVKPEYVINLLDFNSNWLISGNKLKIKLKDLGLQWIEGLKESLKRLG